MPVEIRPGNIYLFKERKPDRTFRISRQFSDAGKRVFCVTRLHPDQLRENYGIPPEKVLWLSNAVGERNVNPQNVGILTDVLIKFFEKERGVVLVLEGLEYLILQNDFPKILKFVNYLYEAVTMNKGVLLSTIDPRAFSTQELAFLEKNTVSVEEQDKVSLPPQ